MYVTSPVFAVGQFAFAPLATYRFHHDFDSARAGVNYHFGGPIVAKY